MASETTPMRALRTFLQIILCTWMSILAIGAQAETVLTYYVNDVTKSPIVGTNQDGLVVWTQQYQAFGKADQSDSQHLKQSIHYTGHAYQADTGLVYAGARHYDPVVGRFMGADPVDYLDGRPNSFNRYAYGANNPYKYSDPSGKVVESIWDAISIAYDAGKIGVGYATGNAALVMEGKVDMAVDLTALLVPGVPAGGSKVARAMGKSADAVGDMRQAKAATKKVPKDPPIQQVDPRNLISTQTRNEMSGSQAKRLKKDMQKNGFDQSQPIDAVKNQRGRLEIQDGHHRTEAAKKAGLKKVPVRVWGDKN